MYRRNALAALLTGLAGAIPAARHAAAQHHTMAPATASGDGRGVLIFAAATWKPALDPIVSAYRAKEGGEVTIAYGPTPALAKQIENGAPADIFLSADPIWMDYLAERRLIRRHTRADLVGNLLILAGRGPQSAETPVVIDRTFPLAQVVGTGPLCMCNPADHPAGRYGKASLEALGLWETVASKIAIVDNPQIAVVMVARGDAPAAVVFATDIKGVPDTRRLGTFSEASHPPDRLSRRCHHGGAACRRGRSIARLPALCRSPHALRRLRLQMSRGARPVAFDLKLRVVTRRCRSRSRARMVAAKA